MRSLILTNGDYGDYSFCKNIADYDDIICADNGMKHARYLGIVPHLIVGDFDSGNQEDLEFFKSKEVPVQLLSSIKDETDTEIAVDLAIQRGAKNIDLFGGTGSRLDHTLANVHLLYKVLIKGLKARILSAHNEVYLIRDSIEFTGNKGDIISLLPFSLEVSGVNTFNLGYPVKDGVLPAGKPYGVSNYMTDKTAAVTIENGILIVIKARD